jgi:hypothetical protein
MKHLLALTLILAAGAASADEYCTQYHDLAKKVIEMRYKGASMIKMIDAADDNKLFKQLIMTAYREPKYRVEANQREHIAEFANEQYLLCVEVRG